MFTNRRQAGKELAEKLGEYKNKDSIVLALPRGGVLIGAEIAKALSAPLDVVISRKIGAPGAPEFAVGAVGTSGEIIRNKEANVDDEYLKIAAEREKKEIIRREKIYHSTRGATEIKNKTVILTDDGIATGLTIISAIAEVRAQKPKQIILAIPVLPESSVEKFKKLSDKLIYLEAPRLFFAVGQFYEEFDQISDKEVVKILSKFK